MPRRHPKRGTNGGRFARLPLSVLETHAVITLTHAAFRILVLLAAAYKGDNNGALGITANQARDAGIGGKNTLYQALSQLVEHQLIVMTYPASRVPPRPTMYALTWLAVDDTDYSQRRVTVTHPYRSWKAAA